MRLVQKIFIPTLFISVSTLCSSQAHFYQKLAEAAKELTKQKVIYDQAFYTINYPKGDVSEDRWAYIDVVIRPIASCESICSILYLMT